MDQELEEGEIQYQCLEPTSHSGSFYVPNTAPHQKDDKLVAGYRPM
jgi:hypothetical protein